MDTINQANGGSNSPPPDSIDHVHDGSGTPNNNPPPLSSRGEPKGPPQACLFVASLSAETTEESLRDLFQQFGKILKIKLLKDRSARPYSFVQYSTIEEATAALQNTNGKALDGRRLRVEKAKVNRTLFIAKISKTLTSQEKLRKISEEYGPVESVTLIKNHQTNKSKGCGFVKYIYREDAMDAFMGLKNTQRKWVIEWATSTNDPDILGVDKNNIFVGGLNPQLISKELLEERFGSYGDVESITLVNKDENVEGSEDAPPRSAFAFVRFTDPASSAVSIEQQNGVEWLGRRIRVQYCESQEMKNKRRNTKYMNTPINHYNQQYYRSMQMPTPAMMMQMGGVAPPMYNMNLPMDASNNLAYATSFTYPVFQYGNGQWLYGPQAAQTQQPPQQSQSPHQQRFPDMQIPSQPDENIDSMSNSFSHIGLGGGSPTQQRSPNPNPW